MLIGTFYYLLTLCKSLFLLIIIFITGCQSSDVSLVKDSPFPFDKSITIGKLFDTYQYCEDGKWTVDKTDRGQKFVEFRAKYSNLALISSLRNYNKIPEKMIDKFAELLDSSNVKAELVAQFLIDTDNKSYELSFLGIDYKGETKEYSPKQLEEGLQRIYKNDNFYSIPNALRNSLFYYYEKFVLNQIDIQKLQSVAVIHTHGLPINIYQVTNIIFDDIAEIITLTIAGKITNLTPEDIPDFDSKIPDTVEYKVLKELHPMNLTSNLDEARVDRFEFKGPTFDTFTFGILMKDTIEILYPHININSLQDNILKHI